MLRSAWLIPLFLVILAPARAEALQDTYRAMLRDYRRYAETRWHPAKDYIGMGYWDTGRAVDGDGTRSQTCTALAYAVLYVDGDRTFPVHERLEPAIRYAAETYAGGSAKGTDGKQWGSSWQSRMFAGNLGVAAWLVRGELDPAVYQAVCRLVAKEADRCFAPPPDAAPGDTKAEENAWDLTALSAALLMMPGHDHAARWREALSVWALNTLSVPADRTSATVVDGKPLKDRVITAQYFPDFTLENHGVFHPVYAMVAPATLGQAAVALALGGQPIPDALKHHVPDTWKMLQTVMQDDGEWLYPQGLDWDLHDYEHLHYLAMLASVFKDRPAALLEARAAAAARRRQLLNGGAFVGPSGNLGFLREAVQAERVAFSLMFHQRFGAPEGTDADWAAAKAALAPARAFDQAGFVVHRSAGGLASFSWLHQMMGALAPASEKHLDQPYVSSPNPFCLVGRFALERGTRMGERDTQVFRRAYRVDRDGFALALDSRTNEGRLRQEVAVASVSPGVIAYVDRVTAIYDVAFPEERGLWVPVENGDVTGGLRRVTTEAGTIEVKAGVARGYPLQGNWANVDGRLGLIAPGSTLYYRAAGLPNRPGAREDALFGSYSGVRREVAHGGIVAQRAGLILLDASADETKRLSALATVARDALGTTLSFTAPDGRKHSLRLGVDALATWDGQAIEPLPKLPGAVDVR